MSRLRSPRRWENGFTAVGLLLLLIYLLALGWGEFERRRAVAAFENAFPPPSALTQPLPSRPAATQVNDAATSNADALSEGPDRSLWSANRAARFEQAQAQADATLPIALLRIPRLQLDVPVYAESTARNLNRGAGLIRGHRLAEAPGNRVIAAHRDGYFRALQDLLPGDELQLQLPQGLQRYRVSALSVTEPEDVRSLRDRGVAELTLITCFPFHFAGSAPQRFIVRADALP